MHLLPRALAAALLGALAGAACLVAAAGWHPTVAFEMEWGLPSYVTGFYPLERDGDETFAWTGKQVAIALAEADRRVPWTCEMRFRGSRPSDDVQPELVAAVDGLRVAAWRATNEYQAARVTVPATPAKPGLAVSFTASQLWEPGPADPRLLGVQVDRLWCAPSSGVMLPPRPALGAAAVAAAILGAGFALTGVTAGSAVGAVLLMAIGQAVVLVSGGGLYGSHPVTAMRLATVIACVLVLTAVCVRLGRKEALRNTARFALAFSAGALYLQLLALLHPAKPVVDAVFHAHRFDSVLAGHWYFTQLSTSATPFPYAIGLYLFSIPWAWLTTNHVALLRVVVSSSEIVAGVLLYPLVVRNWGHRLTGAVAVALFSLAPLSYTIIGNANLTNAFGQAVSVVAVALIGVATDRLRRPLIFAGLVAVLTLGLIAHISTLVLLPATTVVMALLFHYQGGKPLRGVGLTIVAMTLMAIVGATAIYWGHFGDVYRLQFDRARAAVSAQPAPRSNAAGQTPRQPAAGQAAGAERANGAPPEAAGRLGHSQLSMVIRAGQALRLTAESIGWPVVLLALAGAWRAFRERRRDVLDLTVLAWAIVWLVLGTASVVSPANRTYQQDAFEFISRVVHATLPAAVLLAARGATWAWSAGAAARTAAVGLLAWTLVTGVRAWAAWLV